MARLTALGLLVLAIGCGGEVSILDGTCSLEGAAEIGALDGPAVHDLALSPREGGAWAVWSEDSGLYLAALDASGAVAEETRRIGPPCPAGLDASGTPLLIACGIPALDAKGDPGHVVVYQVSDDAVRARERFSPVGPDAAGVAIAASSEGYHLAWHDARDGVSSVWAIDVAEGDVEERAALRELMPEVAAGPSPVRVSHVGLRAGPPSLLAVGGHRYLSWAETTLDPEGDPIGEILVQEDDGAPRAIATVQHELAAPTLASARGDARVLVTFRDRRRRGRPRAYSMWLPPRGQDGALSGGAPANTDGPALAVPCMGAVIAVAPRTHSRHERLVSVRRHADPSLEGMGPELQLYEHGAPYEHAAALCIAGTGSLEASEHLLVLYAARRSDDREPGGLRATAVRCHE